MAYDPQIPQKQWSFESQNPVMTLRSPTGNSHFESEIPGYESEIPQKICDLSEQNGYLRLDI